MSETTTVHVRVLELSPINILTILAEASQRGVSWSQCDRSSLLGNLTRQYRKRI